LTHAPGKPKPRTSATSSDTPAVTREFFEVLAGGRFSVPSNAISSICEGVICVSPLVVSIQLSLIIICCQLSLDS
jgi:hypothetical protein